MSGQETVGIAKMAAFKKKNKKPKSFQTWKFWYSHQILFLLGAAVDAVVKP